MSDGNQPDRATGPAVRSSDALDLPGSAIPTVTWGEFVRWLLRFRVRLTVTGASMFPILKPNDQILYDPRAFRRKKPARGDIVVTMHPVREDQPIVKRVAAVHPDGLVDLQGENPFETTDFRGVPAGKIIGKVTSIFHEHQETGA